MIRITALAGIAWFILSTAGIMLLVVAELPEAAMEAADVEAVLGAFSQSANITLTALMLLLISIICAGVFGAGITQMLQPNAPSMGLARALLLVGVSLFLFETLISISLAQIAAAAFQGAPPEVKTAWEVPLRILMQLRNNGALLGSTLLSLSAVFLGWIDSSSASILPKWTGWLVLISGILGLVGSLTSIFPNLSSIRQAGLFGFALWGMIVAIGLLRSVQVTRVEYENN